MWFECSPIDSCLTEVFHGVSEAEAENVLDVWVQRIIRGDLFTLPGEQDIAQESQSWNDVTPIVGSWSQQC